MGLEEPLKVVNGEEIMDPNEEPQSEFARRLLADAELAARYEKTLELLRNAGQEDLEYVEQSERLTREDFSIVINTRADSLCDETD